MAANEEFALRLKQAVIHQTATCTRHDIEAIIKESRLSEGAIFAGMCDTDSGLDTLLHINDSSLQTEAMRGKDASVAELDRIATRIRDLRRVKSWFTPLTDNCCPSSYF